MVQKGRGEEKKRDKRTGRKIMHRKKEIKGVKARNSPTITNPSEGDFMLATRKAQEGTSSPRKKAKAIGESEGYILVRNIKRRYAQTLAWTPETFTRHVADCQQKKKEIQEEVCDPREKYKKRSERK